MSREIKFRLYSKDAGRYIDYCSLGFSSSGEIKNMSNENGVGPIFPEDYIVEQYTGLKDKNGKEIYEGDIVTWDDEDDEDIAYSLVVWNEERGGFEEAGSYEGGVSWLSNTRVAGNIHENPELLKEENEKGN